MPIGVVENADPIDVMPQALCRSFRRSQQYGVLENRYTNGWRQARVETTTSRKTWELQESLTVAEIAAIETFYVEHIGDSFLFYDLFETDPLFTNDLDGVSAIGQYKARFDSPFELTLGIGSLRGSLPLRIIEVA